MNTITLTNTIEKLDNILKELEILAAYKKPIMKDQSTQTELRVDVHAEVHDDIILNNYSLYSTSSSISSSSSSSISSSSSSMSTISSNIDSDSVSHETWLLSYYKRYI